MLIFKSLDILIISGSFLPVKCPTFVIYQKVSMQSFGAVSECSKSVAYFTLLGAEMVQKWCRVILQTIQQQQQQRKGSLSVPVLQPKFDQLGQRLQPIFAASATGRNTISTLPSDPLPQRKFDPLVYPILRCSPLTSCALLSIVA